MGATKVKILVVDDDPNLRKTLSDILRVKGYESITASSGADAIASAERETVGLALIDLMLPDMTGLEVMERIKAVSPLTEAIILTGHASMDTAIEATRKGAFSYILKPYQMDDLLLNIRHGIERQQAREEIIRLASFPRLDPSPIIEIAPSGEVIYLNPAAEKSFPDLMSAGAGHPLVDGLAGVMEVFRRGGKTEAVREVPVGKAIYEQRLSYVPESGLIRAYIVDITERRKALETIESLNQQLNLILQSAGEGIVAIDAKGKHLLVNPAASRMLGYGVDELIGYRSHGMWHHSKADGAPYPEEACPIYATLRDGRINQKDDEVFWRKDGSSFPVEYISAPLLRGGEIGGGVIIFQDITRRKQAEAEARTRLTEVTRINAELKELNDKLAQAQSQLLQSEKMASLGTLAAGVAHEINNPIGFVYSNLGTLESYVRDFLCLLECYEKVEALHPEMKELFSEAGEIRGRIDLAYLKQDVAGLLSETRQGLDRVKQIVLDLKDFSRLSVEENWGAEDIHRGIESTLNVIWNELKYKCEVKKEYGELPPVECLLSQLNQVFMNLLVNAAQAIETRGTITIRTGTEGDWVWIGISDTGKGISPENLQRIFDPFFTTKPVGQGTGLGLSVSYSIIQKHHGRIEVESEEGKGTTFRIWLPVMQPESRGEISPAIPG